MAKSIGDTFAQLGYNGTSNDILNELAKYKYTQATTAINNPTGNRYEFTKWVNETFVGGTAVHSMNGTTIVRVPTGSNSFLEHILLTGIVDSDINHAKSMVQSWALMNGIRLKIEDAIEKVPEEPKKRVRMGKWGIKKEHIRP